MMSEYCLECGKHNGVWLCKKHAAVDDLLAHLEMAEQTIRNIANGEIKAETATWYIALNAAAHIRKAIAKAKGE
jgi:hypothetical protein